MVPKTHQQFSDRPTIFDSPFRAEVPMADLLYALCCFPGHATGPVNSATLDSLVTDPADICHKMESFATLLFIIALGMLVSITQQQQQSGLDVDGLKSDIIHAMEVYIDETIQALGNQMEEITNQVARMDRKVNDAEVTLQNVKVRMSESKILLRC